MTTKLYCKLGIFPISFAGEDHALPILGVADTGAFAHAGAAGGGVGRRFGAVAKLQTAGFKACSTLAKEGGGVVERAAAGAAFDRAKALRGVGFCP